MNEQAERFWSNARDVQIQIRLYHATGGLDTHAMECPECCALILGSEQALERHARFHERIGDDPG